MDVITLKSAAERLGISLAWAQKQCAKHQIGQLINPRLRLLSPADLEKLRGVIGGRVGNPNLRKNPAKKKRR
jgi:hypothetical protein